MGWNKTLKIFDNDERGFKGFLNQVLSAREATGQVNYQTPVFSSIDSWPKTKTLFCKNAEFHNDFDFQGFVIIRMIRTTV